MSVYCAFSNKRKRKRERGKRKRERGKRKREGGKRKGGQNERGQADTQTNGQAHQQRANKQTNKQTNKEISKQQTWKYSRNSLRVISSPFSLTPCTSNLLHNVHSVS